MMTSIDQPENTKAAFIDASDIVTLNLMRESWRRDYSHDSTDEQARRFELVDKILNQAKQQEFSR